MHHAPKRLHDEIKADYTDMIYADTPQEVEKQRIRRHPKQVPRGLTQ
jgi:hypothetical protein